MFKKKTKIVEEHEYNELEKLIIEINTYYACNPTRKTFVKLLTPREIYLLWDCIDIMCSVFSEFKMFHSGDFETLWYRGALLIRKENNTREEK